MSFTKKDSIKLVKQVFIPHLKELGFKPLKSGLGGYRIRDKLIDVMYIQIGRNPGSYYLHYFNNFVFDIFSNVINTNPWGKRLSRKEDGESWFCEDSEHAVLILDEIGDVAKEQCIRELDGIKDEKDFLNVYLNAFSGKSQPASIVVGYAACNLFDKALDLIELKFREYQKDEFFNPDKNNEDKEILENLSILKKAIDSGSTKALLQEWYTRNLNKHSLKL